MPNPLAHARSQTFHRYVTNTSWMLAERVVRMGMALFVGVYVARYLGPEQFGLLSYATSFVGLFSAIATLGLDEIVIRNLVRDPEKRESLLGTAFSMKVIGGLLLLISVFIALQLTSSDSFTKLLVLVIAVGLLFQSTNVIDFYFQARVMAKFASRAQLCSLFISSAAKLWLIAFKASLLWFALAVVLENVVLCVSLIFIYRKQNLQINRWRFEKDLAFELLRNSWPLMLSGLAIMVYMRIDQVMIKELLDSEAVGNYAAAVRLSEVWYFIPMAISSSLFPAILNAKKMNKEHYYARLQKLYDSMVWLAIAIALPTTFVAHDIILLLFGDKFQKAGTVLEIHIWTSVFVFLGVTSGKWLLSEGLMKHSFYRTLFGAILNVVLNLILIPKYEIYGAAISTLFAQLTAAYLYDVSNKRTLISFKMKTKSFFPVHIMKGNSNVILGV